MGDESNKGEVISTPETLDKNNKSHDLHSKEIECDVSYNYLM